MTVVTVGGLMGLQALAAIPASAAATACDFTGTTLTVAVDTTTANVFSQDVAGNILLNGAQSPAWVALSDCATSPAANVGNVTAISITGPPGVSATNEIVSIDMELGTGTVSYGVINWTVNLGDEGAAPGDTFDVTNAASLDSLTTDWGASGVDLNGDGDLDVVLADIETSTHEAGDGPGAPDFVGDTVNAGGSTATGAAYPTSITITGGANDDTLTGGAAGDVINAGTGDDTLAGGLGNDTLNGDLGVDTVDYSASATAVNVNLEANTASGEGLDSVPGIENAIGSAFGDTLTGAAGEDNTITPGAGDDTVSGGTNVAPDPPAGLFGDVVSYSDATAAVTVDLTAGTATGGSGTDSLTGIESADGSDFDDSLIGTTGAGRLRGGAGNDLIDGGTGGDLLNGQTGVDMVDYGLRTASVAVHLAVDNTTAPTGPCNAALEFTSGESAEGDCLTGIENATLGAGDDAFTGSAFQNVVFPNGGQNVLDGDAAGGPATGGDVLDYGIGYTAGVDVNMAGGATAGDSAINFENARGTSFADTFVGNSSSNLIAGRGGNDNLRLGSGDDTGRGGPGNDAIRGGSGDDDLIGARGNDVLFGGGGDDFGRGGPGQDICRGVEVKRSCGTPRNPRAPQAARLV